MNTTRALGVITLVTLATVGCGGKKRSRNHAQAGVNSGSTGSIATSTSGTTGGGTTAGGGSGGGGTTGGGTTGGGTTGGGGTSGGSARASGVFYDGSNLLPSSAEEDWSVAAGDVNGDGRPDLLIGVNAGSSRVLLNQGGAFTVSTGAFPSLTMNATDVHLVDMDGDQDLDAVVASNYEPVRVFTNDGTGQFTLLGSFSPNNSGLTYKVAVGDVDGNGSPDVYMANAGQNAANQGRDELLLNDGTGRLVTSASFPSVADDTIGAVLVDVDNDTDLDLFTANFVGGHRLLLNDGQGGFTDASSRLPTLPDQGATAVQAADVTGDGYADLFVANEGLAPAGGGPPAGHANTILINDGAGSFIDGTALLPATASATFNVRLADFDDDGFIDAVTANLRAEQRLYFNRNSFFSDVTSTNLPPTNVVSNAMGLAVADFNGDRTLDVVIVRRGDRPFLFLNRPR